MAGEEKEVRELRRLLRDVVALATTPAGWVGRDRTQIANGLVDILLHTLRADAVYLRLGSSRAIEVVRSPQHPEFADEIRRLWPQSATVTLHVDNISLPTWPKPLRIAVQPVGISGDEGFVVIGCASAGLPSEAEALLLSLAANQAAVALQSKVGEEATGHLAAIVSSSDDAILSKNLDGVIRSWNESAERLFGYTVNEAVGKHITLIVPPDRRKEEENILSRLRRGERIDHFETVRMRKDGSTFDLSLTISPIKDSSGRIIGASNVARDISHLKRIERELRDSEERLRALVKASSYIVYRMSPDWSEMRQLNAQGFLVDSPKRTKDWLQEYIHPDDQAFVLAAIEKAKQNKSVLNWNTESAAWTEAWDGPFLAPCRS